MKAVMARLRNWELGVGFTLQSLVRISHANYLEVFRTKKKIMRSLNFNVLEGPESTPEPRRSGTLHVWLCFLN